MKRDRMRRLTALRIGIAMAALATMIALPAVASAATWTTGGIQDVWVSGAGQVTVTWMAAVPAVGTNTVTYKVLRMKQRITAANAGSATVVLNSTTATSAVITADANEVAESYVWYYAVQAIETGQATITSTTMHPNPHGYRSMSMNDKTCKQCHSAHSAPANTLLDFRSVDLCYHCHASSSSTSPETKQGDKSTYNIKADFKDYSTQTAGSRHNLYATSTYNAKCEGCHTPHRSPYFYNDTTVSGGAYDPAQSLRKLLRVALGLKAPSSTPAPVLVPDYGSYPTTASPAYYSRNTSIGPTGAFCLYCHGTTSKGIDNVSIDDAGTITDKYGPTGGDHNSANYATSAHGWSMSDGEYVVGNDTTKTVGSTTYNAGEYPELQCLACHEKHASAADKLIAYRGQDTTSATTSGTFAQADLCFACHSAAGATREKAAGTSAGGTNLTWNGRDIKSEFTLSATRRSAHPVTGNVTPPAQTAQTMTYTTTADFNTFGLTNTVVDSTIGDGAVRLAEQWNGTTISTYLFNTNPPDTTFWNSASSGYGTSAYTSQKYEGTGSWRQATAGTDGIVAKTGLTTTGYDNLVLTFYTYETGTANAADYIQVDTYTGSTWTTSVWKQTNPLPAGQWLRWDVPLTVGINGFRITVHTLSTSGGRFCIDALTLTGNKKNGYQTSGTAVSPLFEPASLVGWTSVTGTQVSPLPTGTTLTYDVLNSAGTTLLAGKTLPIDLTSLNTPTPPTSLQVEANLTGGTNTPNVQSLTLNYVTAPRTPGQTSCANCHNVHYVQRVNTSNAWEPTRTSDPFNTKETTSSVTTFCLGCHKATPPAAKIDSQTIVPYTVKWGDQNGPYFTGMDKNSAWTASGHNTAAAADGRALCQTCHDPHASDNKALVAWTLPTGVTWLNNLSISGTRVNTGTTATEENLCYNCHGDGTAAHPKANGAANVYTPATSLGTATNNHHPIADYTWRHDDRERAVDLGGTNRHSECVDCHDPHTATHTNGSATSATHTSGKSNPGGALYGAVGSVPNYSTAAYNWGDPTSYTPSEMTSATTSMEAYLCFKCHSGNTVQPTGQTDIAQDFNPSNASSHNVLGQSVSVQTAFTINASNNTTYTTTWAFPTVDVFKAGSGLTQNSMLTCTSCHTSETTGQAKGPHGSSVKWLLDPVYPTDWKTAYLGTTNGGFSLTGTICSKCHTLYGTASGYNTWGNQAHSEGNHQGTSNPCIRCHIKIPHGWKRPRLLGYTSDPAVYATTGLTQINAQTNHTLTTGAASWPQGDCQTSCSGHSNLTAYWK